MYLQDVQIKRNCTGDESGNDEGKAKPRSGQTIHRISVSIDS